MSRAVRRRAQTLGYSAKIARRELWRHRWRTLLVVLLIAVPTCITINTLIFIRTSIAAENIRHPDFGSDLVVPIVDPEPDSTEQSETQNQPYRFVEWTEAKTAAEVEAAVPPNSTLQRFKDAHTSIMTDDGDIETAYFVITDLGADAASSWAPLSEGRAAASADEVVLGEGLASRLNLTVGDTMTLRQPPGTWRLVGISSWNDDNLLAVRDFDESQLSTPVSKLLVDLPQDTEGTEVGELAHTLGGSLPLHSRYMRSARSADVDFAEIALDWLLAMLFFVMFGVIIVAAFATIARSQLVTIGQLAANGARVGFTRQMLAMQGFWAGLAGVCVGALATVATIPFVRPLIAGSFQAPIPRLEWSPIDVMVIVLIGVAVATVAAAIPTLGLARISVLDALAGRPAQRPVPTWMVPAGVVIFGVGLALMAATIASSSDASAAASMIGLLATAIGVCLVAPLAVQLASRAAAMMPLPIRISLRGLGRTRLRSAAVVSSIAVTTGIMTIIVAGMQTSTEGPQPGEIAEEVAFLATFPSMEIRSPDGEALLDDEGASRTDLPNNADTVKLKWIGADSKGQADLVRAILPDATEQQLRVAVRPDGLYDNRDHRFVLNQPGTGSEPGSRQIHPGPFGEVSNLPLIADEAVLDGFSLPGSFARELNRAGYATAIPDQFCHGGGDYWRGESVEALSLEAPRFEPKEIELVPVEGFDCQAFLGPFMTERFAADHGYQIEPAGTLFINPAPLTSSERDRLTPDYHLGSVFVSWDYEPPDRFRGRPATASSVAATAFWSLRPGTTVYHPSTRAEDFARTQRAMVGIALLIVTAITGIGLALAAADSGRDRAVLDVIGAKPATRRLVAASDALALVVLGTLLGVPTALFAARVVTASNTHADVVTGVPWPFVAAEFVVVPVVVSAVMYLVDWTRGPVRPMTVLHSD